METKKILAPTILAIVTLVLITVGATYAYFVVNTDTKQFETRTAEASTPSLGSVALASGTNLSMTLTTADMMQGSSDITYYASSTGKTTTATTETIGTATVTGAGTFDCNYTLTVTDNDNSLYDAFQSWNGKTTGQIVLTVNGTDYDFNEANLFSNTISGSFTGLKEGTNGTITASLKIVNKKDVNQNDLANKSITLSFAVSDFKCTATA